MVPVLVAGALGFAIGACRRPHGRHLANPVLALPAAAVVGAGLQLAGGFDLPAGTMLLAASLALLSGFSLVNRHLVGMGVLAVGLCCNFAAVLIHDGMPVRATALVASGAVDAEDLADTDLGAGRRFERTNDPVPILGDVIPVEPFRAAMSFGDLIALTGVAVLAGDLARYVRRGSRWSLTGPVVDLVGRRGTGPPPLEPAGEAEAVDPVVAADQDVDDIIDLNVYSRLSAAEWLAAQAVGQLGVDGEQVRILDVSPDGQELHRRGDVVDAEDRVRR